MFDSFTGAKKYSSHSIILQSTSGRGCLALGDLNSVTDHNIIKANNIKTIITAASNMDHLDIDKSVKHIVYPLLDSKNQAISHFFEDNFDSIETSLKRGGVLIHCAAGVSRSATLVIAYLMKKNSWGFKEAISFVRKFRPQVCPNLGFQMQLKKYEKQLNKKGEQRLIKTMIPSKSNITTNFNEFMTSQRSNGFPNISSVSQGQNHMKHSIKSRTCSKEESNSLGSNDNIFQRGLMVTSVGFSGLGRNMNYHSSSVHKNFNELQQRGATNKKIAALMFQSKVSKQFNSNSQLRKSDIKITGFK